MYMYCEFILATRTEFYTLKVKSNPSTFLKTKKGSSESLNSILSTLRISLSIPSRFRTPSSELLI